MFSQFLVVLAGSASALALPGLTALLERQVSIKASSPYDRTWIGSVTSIGDSYSVGLGAGHAIKASKNVELNGDCYQYSFGYPNLLNADTMIGANPDRKFQYLGCSSALVTDIQNKQVPKMQKSQVITISAGGNDAHLATILNYCVFQWFTLWGWSCDGELKSAKDEINSAQYTNNLKSLLSAVSGKLADSNSRIYWPGYIKFFDTTTKDCDSVTWSFSRNFGYREYLTQARRQTMNELVDLTNSKIKSVCDATPQCVYIDNEHSADLFLGRYCEPGVNEKYWGGSPAGWNREQTFFYEWSTTKDDDDNSDKNTDQPIRRQNPGTFNNASFEGAIANWVKLGKDSNSIDTTGPNPPDVTVQGLPDWIGRVFHLDKSANLVVAYNIIKAMVKEQSKIMNQPAATKTLGECQTAATAAPKPPTCDADLNANFPKYWILSDGNKYDASNIYFRMRDKACQNICDASKIDGVPSQFVRAKRVSDRGCQYAVKIANNKELYFYTTNDGDNCYKATENIINTCGKSKLAGWVNGGSPGEFYQVGVRDINTIGPGNSMLDSFPDDKQHLGYMHLACRRTDGAKWEYDFQLKLSGWDDGDWGKSIMHQADKCEKVLHTDHWKYEPEDANNAYQFQDGSKADHWSSWTLAMTIPDRCGEKSIETVLGLKEGSVKCSNDGWSEVDMFSS